MRRPLHHVQAGTLGKSPSPPEPDDRQGLPDPAASSERAEPFPRGWFPLLCLAVCFRTELTSSPSGLPPIRRVPRRHFFSSSYVTRTEGTCN